MAGAAIGAVATAYAADQRADAAGKASKRSAKGAARAAQIRRESMDDQLEFLRESREQSRSDLQPFRQAGVGALQQYQNLLEDPSQMAESPGLQFLQSQGQRQVESSASAGGMQLSGRTLGALQQRGQNTASQYRSQILGEIGQLINVGQSAAAGQATSAMQAGQASAGAAGQAGGTLANLRMGQGNAQAAGILGQGNAEAGMIEDIGVGLGDAASQVDWGNLFGGQTSEGVAGNVPMRQ